MPDLAGVPVVTAQSALTKVGIKTGTPVYVAAPLGKIGSGSAMPVPPLKPGAVVAQTPPAGARVDQSTMVKLTVAR